LKREFRPGITGTEDVEHASQHMPRINKALQQQLDLNRTKNLLYAQLNQIIEIDPDFLAALEDLLASDKRSPAEQSQPDNSAIAAHLLLERLYAINQFLQVDEQQVRELESIYRRTWQRIVTTQDIRATLRDYHYPELANWIARLYPQDFREQLRTSPTIGHVICAEYSPQLQIDLLKLDLSAIPQPVLDIGCGGTAGLVRHLRALQIESYGIDRQIEKAETYLQQLDWFEYEFEPETWGTLISNMAFTNHLLYAYHHDSAQLESYLRKFKDIIAALAIGGSFHYAPSLPFVEQRLAATVYRVERSAVVTDISLTRLMRIAK
jgi:hypothetical protein